MELKKRLRVVIELIAWTVSAESEFLCVGEKLNASCRCVDHYVVFALIGRCDDEWQNSAEYRKTLADFEQRRNTVHSENGESATDTKKFPDAAICVAPDVQRRTNTWRHCLAVSLCSRWLQRISAILKHAANAKRRDTFLVAVC